MQYEEIVRYSILLLLLLSSHPPEGGLDTLGTHGILGYYYINSKGEVNCLSAIFQNWGLVPCISFSIKIS